MAHGPDQPFGSDSDEKNPEKSDVIPSVILRDQFDLIARDCFSSRRLGRVWSVVENKK